MAKPTFTYKYPRPALTVDGVVLGLDSRCRLQVLLIKRSNPPFQGCWALPGGFVDNMSESVDDAIRRELEEETSVTGLFLEQLYTFGSVGRDPRERVVSVAYFALVRSFEIYPKAGSDASATQWFAVSELPELAFDHASVIAVALARIQAKVRYQPLGFELLPKKFTLAQLQAMYESILEKSLDKRNFQRKITSFGILKDTGETVKAKTAEARLFSFDKAAYGKLLKQGFNFEV